METLILLIPVLPLLGFMAISLGGKKMSWRIIGTIAAGSVTISAILTIITGITFLNSSINEVSSTIYTWLTVDGFTASVTFLLDPLSLLFCFVITFVGGLIHIYSIEYMMEDEGFRSFFAYMNLFVGSMLILVLADNLLLLYLGWEGVGLCSYLLIGFWYRNPQNGNAAGKAFIVTRIGDTLMIIGLFLLLLSFGTLNIKTLMQEASENMVPGSPLAVISSLLILGGALGKSAQVPLQVWLPDAMAGPSPVSALIHAATMVTAGVYLVTRTHVLFSLAPLVMSLVAIIGAVTLLIAGLSALAQTDLKRVLAYSTISQIGYMFLAMGIGAWSAAIFHFMIHAFFKALLFLAAGVIIHLLHHEQNMFRMGGLRKELRIVFLTFLAGAASLSALPLVTAGFYSKEQILLAGWDSPYSNHMLWLAGFIGAFITSLYTFRMVFLVFYGETRTRPLGAPGIHMMAPLVILAGLSLIAGFIEVPVNMGNTHLLSRLFKGILPQTEHGDVGSSILLQLAAMAVTLAGVGSAFLLYIRYPSLLGRIRNSPLAEFLHSGMGFDRTFDRVLVRPFVWLSKINKNDFVDLIYSQITRLSDLVHLVLSRSQNGRLRLYALIMSSGLVLILIIVLSL